MSWEDANTYRYTTCAQCGDRFKDDCGDSFCSSSCEREYEREHVTCERCGNEFHENDLNNFNECENCEDEE